MPRNARTASVKTRLMLIAAAAVAGVFIGSTAAQASSAGSVTPTAGAVVVTDGTLDDDNTPWGSPGVDVKAAWGTEAPADDDNTPWG